jgi:hypothetical protein
MSVHFGETLLHRPSERGGMKQLYQEGSWFAIPLVDGGYGTGLIARLSPGGKMLVYLFGPRLAQPPALEQLASLGPQDALKVLRVGDMAMASGRWPVLGQTLEFDHRAWPVPQFLRRIDSLRRAWRVTYADTDPSRSEREESVPYDTEGLEADSLFGYGSTELLLSRLLA